MAYNVNFLKGTAQSFADLAVKSKNTFYYIDEKDLYIGETKLTNGEDLVAAVDRISTNESDIRIIKAQLEDLTGGGGGEDSSLTQLISELSARLTTAEKNITSEAERATQAENNLQADIDEVSENLTLLTQTVNDNETDIENKVSNLTTRVSTVEENSAINSSQLAAALNRIQGHDTTISTIQGNINDLETLTDLLVGSDANKSIRAIAIEVLVEQLLADGNTENFETLQQLAAWLADHPEEVAEMNLAIQTNASAISDLQTANARQDKSIEDLIAEINNLKAEDGGLLSQANAYTDTKFNTANQNLENYKSDNSILLGELNQAISKNTQDIAAINDPTSGLLSQAQVKINELKNSLGTAAYKNVEDFDAAGSAAAALEQAKAYTDTALTWGEIQNS